MLTTNDFLAEMHARGAMRLSRVRFRNNRTTVWSLTRGGTVLNVHSAYRAAPPALLDAFALLAVEGGIGSAKTRRAADRISSWPQLAVAIEAARTAHHEKIADSGAESPTRCCGTDAQRGYLRALYRYFNATRFHGFLPDDIPVRLSNRMRSALGHMLPSESEGRGRFVVEIALNVDLLLEGNGAERVDTLLHEMAHAADYLSTGERGHGASWRAWARRAGCQPTTLYERPVVSRRRRRDRVTRVPALPPAVAGLAG